ncbi:CHAT domain-containing protein [Streptomyces griseoaurantiacus]|uniref:CHAT domain-containing protein n=1 Tax=Streptomyces griseoaurantiacus TaxID=68213 RepID=UPI0036CBC80E
MNISLFDPFAPGAADELHDWLAHRNELEDDEAVVECALPLSGLIGRTLLRQRLRHLPLFARSWRFTRLGRSGPTRIGLYPCDLAGTLDSVLWWRVLAVRWTAAALTVAECLLLDVPGWAVLWLPVTVWVVTGWRRRPAVALQVAVLAWTAWEHPSVLGAAVPAALLAVLVRLLLMMLKTGVMSYARHSSPVAFLGRHFLLRALWDTGAARLALAVDKATHDDRARTACFLDGAEDTVPDRLRPVVVQCRALAALADLEFRSAMVLSEEARTLAADAPSEIRGWCALQAGDVLLAAGQPAAAEVRWQEATQLLKAAPRARHWAAEAELRMIECLTADPADTARCVEGLRILCRIRHGAIRAGNLAVLSMTERHLLRLMHEAGNTVGEVEQLAALYELQEGRRDLGTSVADHAAEMLLLASLYLDVIENPDRYPDTLRVDDDGQHERYVYLAGLTDNVLRHLSRSKMPLLEAQAYAVMARVQRAAGRHAEALGNALESLQAVQRVRYHLPTPGWRARWLAAHAHVYAMALDLAVDDAPLVAELLEIVRAQSVPVESDEPGMRLRAVFDLLVSSTGLPPGGRDGEVSFSDPLMTDRTILIEHASWVGGDATGAVDLDEELDLIVPSGWYWSYARVGEWVYHAVRAPSGDWHAERRPQAQLAPAFKDLALHLPVNVPGAERVKERIEGSAFNVHGADDPAKGYLLAHQVWERIFGGLSTALIPAVLRDALTASPTPVPLAVAPTGALALVPVCALPVTPARNILDAAYVSYLPSIALLSRRRRLTVGTSSTPAGGVPSRVLSVLAPHAAPGDEGDDLEHAAGEVPDNSEVAPRPLTKRGFADLIARHGVDDTVLHLAGHVRSPDKRDPGGTGFAFHDGRLSLHDFYRTTGSGAPLYPMPTRVLLAACASIGLYGRPYTGYAPSLLDVPEWLGLGAAVVHGGAWHVYCTLYQVPDSPHTARIDLALVDALRRHAEPSAALRAVQRAELRRWRDGTGSLPLAFLAYAYVGLGAAPGREIPALEQSVHALPAPRPRTPRHEPAVPPRPMPQRTYDSFIMLSRHTFGEESVSDRLHPRFGADGRLLLTSYDGEAYGPVPVRMAEWRKEDFDTGEFRMNSTTEWRQHRLSLQLTDARLVLTVDRPDAQGRTLAGHIRYPWISAVGFRPKQSFLHDCELVVQCQQDTEGTDIGATFYRLVLLLDREADSAGLAQHLVRRLARHHLAHASLPTALRPSFEALRTAPLLPTPAKGDHATYFLPAFKSYPEGAEYVLGAPVEGTWLGPKVNSED